MYVRYLNGTVVELVKAKYTKTLVQNVDISQVPPTDVSIVRRLGLKWQEWVISGAVTYTTSVMWRDIAQVSLDNASWRNCVTTAVDFPRILIDQTLYELRLNVSPILEGAVVRYPSSGYKWGNQSITGISQAGNVTAKPTIHYLAPLFYAPLSNTLLDITGQSVTFTRTASKVHGGVTYPINTPIFDSGLYISSETSGDVAAWTPPASTVRTIAMQIKSRYPSPWVIGAGAGTGNLLTANQSNAETNTTGMVGGGGTFTRNTTTPIAGAGDFKIVATAGNMYIATATDAKPAVSAGRWYTLQVKVKCVGMASGRQVRPYITWFNAAAGAIGTSYGTSVECPTTATILSVSLQAPALAVSVQVVIYVTSAAAGEILYADNLMLEVIPTTLTIWVDSWATPHNKLNIDTINNLVCWTDGTTVVSLALPAAYMSGTVMDVVLLDNTSHAVTIAVHPAGGSWTSVTGTLAAITWPLLGFVGLEGSIANLIQYPYVLTSAEYQAIAYSSLSLVFFTGNWLSSSANILYIGNRYAGEIVKGSDSRLVNANGADISALLGGTDIPIGSAAVQISETQGLSARWYVEVQRTDV